LRGIKLSDFLLQGFGKDISLKIGIYAKTTTDVLIIENVNVTDAGIGVFLFNPDACSLRASSFQWCALGAVINNAAYPTIVNCVFADNNGVDTITVNGTVHTVKTGGLALAASWPIVSNSVFVRNDTGATPYNSISLLVSNYAKIDNCTINSQKGNGIAIIGSATGYAEVTQISNNTIIDVGKDLVAGSRNGIYILKGNKNHIFGNYIGSSLGGTSVEYAVVEDRAVNTYTGASIVKDNVFYKVQNAGKVALSGSLSADTNNVNIDS